MKAGMGNELDGLRSQMIKGDEAKEFGEDMATHCFSSESYVAIQFKGRSEVKQRGSGRSGELLWWQHLKLSTTISETLGASHIIPWYICIIAEEEDKNLHF
jgi:hypothetical protein